MDNAYKPLREEEYLPVARRILAENDPNLPPLEERIATILFHADQSKHSNRLNYRARIDAEIRGGALVLAIQAALKAIKAEEDRCQYTSKAGQILRATLVGGEVKGLFPTERTDGRPQAHDLKTWPEYYELVISGLKPFELRLNDRDYRVGDYLILREWEPAGAAYTGRLTIAKVLSVICDQTFLQPGYVAMGIQVLV